MSIDDLATKIACQDLLHHFGHALDRGANAEAAELIADDGVALRPAGAPVRGPAVRAMLLKRSPETATRHVISNVVVTPIGTDSAEAVAYVLAYRVRADGPTPRPMPATPQVAGEWRMQFRRAGEEWQISRWEAVAVLASAD